MDSDNPKPPPPKPAPEWWEEVSDPNVRPPAPIDAGVPTIDPTAPQTTMVSVGADVGFAGSNPDVLTDARRALAVLENAAALKIAPRQGEALGSTNFEAPSDDWAAMCREAVAIDGRVATVGRQLFGVAFDDWRRIGERIRCETGRDVVDGFEVILDAYRSSRPRLVVDKAKPPNPDVYFPPLSDLRHIGGTMRTPGDEPTEPHNQIPSEPPPPPSPAPPRTTFREELRALLNRCSREGASNTPDYILSKYLCDALTAFESATRDRDYHNRGLPGPTSVTR
jgi:hypothetical protein